MDGYLRYVHHGPYPRRPRRCRSILLPYVPTYRRRDVLVLLPSDQFKRPHVVRTFEPNSVANALYRHLTVAAGAEAGSGDADSVAELAVRGNLQCLPLFHYLGQCAQRQDPPSGSNLQLHLGLVLYGLLHG